MAKFRAIKKGYYGDVIRDPDGEHAVFEGPDDLTGSWFVKIDDDAPLAEKPVVEEDTVKAEAILDTEADAAVDVNEEAGVETL